MARGASDFAEKSRRTLRRPLGFFGNFVLEREELSLNSAIPFAGRYILKKLLGSGGMGAVYLAADSMLGDDEVALKILHSQLCQNEKHTKRFLREVQLTRKVTHPNVVRTFDAGRENGRLYFTMEYAEGVTLKEKLLAGPLETEQIASIVREIAKGLYAIHQADIIHRDLKPGNVLLTPDGFIKITDFGVAKPGVSDLTGHNEVIGSIPYMAPEVWVGRNVGGQADIYALGVLTYEMATGVLPFEGDSPAEMMCKHLETAPVAPIELRPEVPMWLSDLILKMLQKEQQNRPQGPEEIVKLINSNLDNAVKDPPSVAAASNQEGHQDENFELVDTEFASSAPPSIDAPLESVMERVWAGRAPNEKPKYVEMPTIVEQPDEHDYAHLGRFQRVFRHSAVFVACLALCAALLWRFSNVTSPWLGATWSATQQVPILSSILTTVAIAFLLHSFILAMPIFLLAALRRTFAASVRVWVRATGFMCLMLMLVFGFHLGKAHWEGSKLGVPFTSDRIFSSAEAALVNTTEMAFLVPQGTAFQPILKYKGITVAESGSPGFWQAATYWALLSCYLIYMMRILEAEILTRRSKSLRFRRFCFLAFGAAPIVAELVLLSSTTMAQQLFAIRNVQSGATVLSHAFDRYSLTCAALNYVVLAAAVLVVIPLWLARARRRQA